MSTPKVHVFQVLDSGGIGESDLIPTFASYQDFNGNNITPPAITEIGEGAYKFTPAFPPNQGIVFIINPNDTTTKRYIGALRPEDFLVGEPYVSFLGGGSTTAPVITRVVAPTRSTLEITYSKPVQMDASSTGALLGSNYQIVLSGTSTVLAVLSVVQLDDHSVRLATATQTPGASYNLHVIGVQDLDGNPISGA